jgi:hypothetical protein
MGNDSELLRLIRERAELMGKLGQHRAMVRQLMIDLDTVDGKIRILAPGTPIHEIRPALYPPHKPGRTRSVAPTVLRTLRNARNPFSIQEVTSHVMTEWGMSVGDRGLVKAVTKRVGACLRYQRQKGLIRSIEGPNARLLWERSDNLTDPAKPGSDLR